MERGTQIPGIGDVLGDKYRVERVLGEGGMGVVLGARNLRTNREVAIKWLLPQLMDNAAALKRFEREARVAGSIAHVNVVNVYDIEQDGGTKYIVMELLQGQTLAEQLSGGRALSLQEAAAIFVPVLRGVAAAHAAGVVHRDLKPENVFLARIAGSNEVVPKVLDFGISKICERVRNEVTTLTQEGSVLGTVLYMAPEQLRGNEADERADIYALGVMLYRMLSGGMPYAGNNAIDLALNIASHPPVPLHRRVEGLPSGLEAVVDRALCREAADRFADVESFARALDPFFHAGGERGTTASAAVRVAVESSAEPKSMERPVPTPFVAETTAPRAARTGARRLGTRVGMIVLGILTVAGLAWMLFAQRSVTPRPTLTATSAKPAAPVQPSPATKAAVPQRPARAEEDWVSPAQTEHAATEVEPREDSVMPASPPPAPPASSKAHKRGSAQTQAVEPTPNNRERRVEPEPRATPVKAPSEQPIAPADVKPPAGPTPEARERAAPKSVPGLVETF